MAAKSFLRTVAGNLTQIFGVQTSAGVGNAGDIVALGDDGYISGTMLNGIGPDTATITASEALAAGNYVNIWDSSGPKVRKADASVSGKEAHGYVTAAVASGAAATVYFEGTNTQVTGQTGGKVWLSAATPGAGTSAAPTGTGNVQQVVGFATSATSVNFQSEPPIQLA